MVLPDGVCVMTLLAAVHSEAGTFHSLAAACTSIMRAVAPPLRTYSCAGADAAAAAGREIAPGALARDALAGRRIFGRDLRPVAFELFGDELGKAGEGALAHLRAGDADDDGVVGPDHDPGVDFGRAVGGADHGRSAEGKIEAERKAAAGGGGADDEGAAIEFGHDVLVHGYLPHAFAAAWIASRTCWKVPQRQILVMASSISASVGFGLSLSSAATAMIMPLWQ